MIVLSGYGCEIYDQAYSEWKRVDRAVMADGAAPRVESLWINPAAEEALLAQQQPQQQ